MTTRFTYRISNSPSNRFRLGCSIGTSVGEFGKLGLVPGQIGTRIVGFQGVHGALCLPFVDIGTNAEFIVRFVVAGGKGVTRIPALERRLGLFHLSTIDGRRDLNPPDIDQALGIAVGLDIGVDHPGDGWLLPEHDLLGLPGEREGLG